VTPSEASRELARAVAAIRRMGYGVAAARAATILAFAVVLLWTLVALMPGRLEQPGSIVPMLAALLGLGAAAAAGLATGATLRAFRPALRTVEVERARGLAWGDLRVALELGEATDGATQLGSLHRRNTASALRGSTAGELLPASKGTLRVATGAAVPALGIALVLLGVGARGDGPATPRAIAALVRPWTVTFPPPPPPIRVTPPGGEILRGGSFEFQVSAEGRERVYVGRTLPGRPAEIDTLEVVQGAAAGLLEPVEEEVLFWASDDAGSSTDTFSVIPIDLTTITDLAVSLRYPAYLNRPDEVIRGPVPSLQVPVGTSLGFSLRANRALRRVGLSRAYESRSDTVWLRAAGDRAEGRMVATESAYLSWLPVAEAGVPAARNSPGLHMTVVADVPPEVRFVGAGGDGTLGVDGRLPLVLEAEDDQGLERVDLFWWWEKAGGRRESLSREPLLGNRGARHVLLRPVLDLSGADLLPGDVVAYYATAADRNPSNPETATDTVRVRVAGLVATSREGARQAEDLAGEIRSLQTRTADLGDAARDAERRSMREEPGRESSSAAAERPDFTTSEEARDLLREAEAVRDEVERTRERLQALQDRASGGPWPNQELQRRLGELERLFEEVRGSGLADEIEALERSLAQTDRSDLREALSDLSTRSEDLSK